ncbi:unnamed protein product, partial [Prorocentrum cordatum]
MAPAAASTGKGSAIKSLGKARCGTPKPGRADPLQKRDLWNPPGPASPLAPSDGEVDAAVHLGLGMSLDADEAADSGVVDLINDDGGAVGQNGEQEGPLADRILVIVAIINSNMVTNSALEDFIQKADTQVAFLVARMDDVDSCMSALEDALGAAMLTALDGRVAALTSELIDQLPVMM